MRFRASPVTLVNQKFVLTPLCGSDLGSMVSDERFGGRILGSDQPRGWANVAIDAIPKITGKITRQ
jgi:hypothetical protein